MKAMKRKKQEEEEESVFVPMTDMTVSFLFIVMVLLAFFAVQFSEDDSVSRSDHDAIVAQFETRVSELSSKIKDYEGVIVDLRTENLRLEFRISELLKLNQELTADLEKALNEIARLTDSLVELNKKVITLNQEIYELSNNVADLEAQLNAKDKVIIDQKDKIKSLTLVISMLKIKNDELEVSEKSLKIRVKELLNTITVLRQNDEKSRVEIAILDTLIQKFQFIIQDLNDVIIQSNQTIQKLEERNELLETRILELLDTITVLRRNEEKNKVEIAIRDKIIQKFQNIIQDLNGKVTQRDQIIKELEDKILALEEKMKEDPLEAYLIQSQLRRAEILSEIEKKLKIEFPDILVEVSPENDALRFKGDGLFNSGSSKLNVRKKRIIEKVGILMTEAVACFTINAKQMNYKECNPEGILIEAIQIEGHTDNDTFIRNDRDANIELSAERATSAFFAMANVQPDLLSYKNIKGQPVVSIAGYGDMRPVNNEPKNKAENRRIDLRLIIFTPTSRGQVEALQSRISSSLEILIE